MAASELHAKKRENNVCRQPNYEHGFLRQSPSCVSKF